MRGRQSLQRTGCHEGPTILRPAPCRNPRPSPPSFPGWARRSAGECRACAMGAGGAFKSAKKGRHRRLEGCLVSPRTADLHIGAGGQGRMVRSSGRTEMRWQPRERRGNQYGVQRKCGGVRRVGAGGNRYTVQRWRRWMSRADVGWDPQFCSTPQDPHSLLHSFPCGRTRKL
jgi:hypothetical protein